MDGWITAYLALGSNLGDRQKHISDAIKMLDDVDGLQVVRTSDRLETVPLGDIEQPKYLNAVVELRTGLTAAQLFERLRNIENDLGRIRQGKWSPRTIDLDLLLFGDQIIKGPDLQVPHSQMHLRSFVLEPLCQLAPDLLHPALKLTVAELLRRLNSGNFALDPQEPQLISIAGNIGVGKTTLATAIAPLLNSTVLREPYDTNPFLAQVYAGKKELALDSQLYFLLNRAEQLDAKALIQNKLWISDYIFDKELIYAVRLLDEQQLSLYQRIYDHFVEEAARPVLVIYLTDSPQECLQRIHKRNRPYEQRIELDFLDELDKQYRQLFEQWSKCPVIRLSSSEFDYSSQECIQNLANQVKYYVSASERL